VVQVAVFSDQQLLWPSLAMPPSSTSPLADSGVPRVAILPVTVTRFSESPVCDSCDRLSPNVLEFMLPAWKRELLAHWTKAEVTVISTGDPLLGPDSSWVERGAPPGLPWKHWFDASGSPLIYRPRDRYTSQALRSQLSALGGRLGVTHVFLMDSVMSEVRPWGKSSHHGSFHLSYMALLWNVARGQPEWAIEVAIRGKWWSDLNAPLEPRLEPGLETMFRELPNSLKALWQAEAR
jgi:hypothetical protein